MSPEKNSKALLTPEQAIREIISELISTETIKVPETFKEFVQDIYAKSFPNPELFKIWHVEYVCDQLDEALATGKHFVCVLPRGHWKSTILGHAFTLWQLLKGTTDRSLLYVSYNQDMARYHVREMKTAIRNNPVLSEWFAKDLSHGADSVLRYLLSDGRMVRVEAGGIFAFKRGMHVNAGMVADDLLKDPSSPVDPGELPKIASHFETETYPIPNPGTPIVVVGTPMAPGDLLAKLVDDERFNAVVLPALDPTPDRRVLAPEIRTEDDLLSMQRANRSAFASEYLLMPHFGTDGYFTDEEITACEDITLTPMRRTVDNNLALDREYDFVVAGFDVGKRRHPSHISIFGKRKEDGQVVELYQEFLHNMPYVRQVEILNEVANNFHIDRGYIDNTRGELEERGLQTHSDEGMSEEDAEEKTRHLRGLNRRWELLKFSTREKNTMAQKFEYYVVNNRLKLLQNSIQKEQILVVNRELQAAETPNGHGDAFWSIGLAMLAASELEGPASFSGIGNAQDLVTDMPEKHDTGIPNIAYNGNMPRDEATQAELARIFEKVIANYGEESLN